MRGRNARVRAGWLAAALGGLAGLLVAGASHAGQPVVRIEGPAGDAFVAKLLPELRASGVAVRTTSEEGVGAPSADSSEDAVVRVTHEGTVRIWWNDRASGLVRELDVFDSRAGDLKAAAVRTVEVVRARLLPFDHPAEGPPVSPTTMTTSTSPASPTTTASTTVAQQVAAPSEPSAQPAPAPVPPEPAQPRTDSARPETPPAELAGVAPSEGRSLFGLDLGAVALFAAGGVPPALDLLVMPRWMPVDRLVVRGLLAIPLSTPDVSSAEGDASVREWLAGAALDARIVPAESAWVVLVGAGAAAARVQTLGAAVSPYLSGSGDAAAFFPFVEASVARGLGSRQVRLALGGTLGLGLPEVAIRFSGQDVATWGRPVVATSLALQVDLPR